LHNSETSAIDSESRNSMRRTTYCRLLATVTAGSHETRLEALEYVPQSVPAILYFRFVKGSTIFHVTDTSERAFYYHG